MAYGLPSRGQPDWDDELNNSMEALRADVQSTVAQAAVAASDAAYARNRADEVHTAVIGTADAATAGFVNDNASATAQALSATIAAATPYAGALVENLPAPFFWAHRSGPLRAPEETILAMRSTLLDGADGVEVDVQLLADGFLGVMHDTTVDRTTTATGNVADLTGPTFMSLAIDGPGSVPGANITWPPMSPPLLGEVFERFGNRAQLIIQTYGGTIDKVLTAMERHGVDKRTVVIQSFDFNDLTKAVAAGVAGCALGDAPANHDLPARAADGVTFVGIEELNITQTFINDAHALGLKVVAYGQRVNYWWRVQQLIAMGVDGFFTDDPAFVRDGHTKNRRTTDAFAAQTFIPGHHLTRTDRGNFYAPDEWGWGTYANVQSIAALGYIDLKDGQTFTVEFEANVIDVNGVTTNGFYAAVFTDDGFANGTGSTQNTTSGDGYVFTGRANNTLGATKFADGVFQANLNASFATTGFALDTWLTYRIIVTPTTIRFERKDGTGGATFNDATYRPLRFLHLGRASSATKFRNITVT